MNTNERLSALRASMKKNGLSAYIIPSSDAHQSEYVADHWKCREWISGFTGSAGTVVVTQDNAGLWTDSRYFLQGEQELSGSEIELYKPKDRFASEYMHWIVDQLSAGDTVGIHGDVCSLSLFERYENTLQANKISLNTSHDLFTEVWSDRSPIPKNNIFEHDISFAGKSRLEKIEDIRSKMSALGVDHHLITTLDDIAWIFNIRGNDVEFNPVTIAYALISKNDVAVFIDPEKVDDSLYHILQQDWVSLKPYDSILEKLNKLPEEDTILLDPNTCSITLSKAINCNKKRGKTISQLMKAIKNETEIGHTRSVMAKDGAALAKTFYWLEQSLKQNKRVTEAEFADVLATHRSEMPGYKGESFPAIIGYKANGAIIHYRPKHGDCAEIHADGILLADSGGQYLDGTTDITRTIALGTPTTEEKRNFTLVLQGNIALSRATFPKGTTGAQLDILARKPLWDHGLNYGHGTGHGVGFFLNVHEGPQGFAGLNSERGTTAHQAGMITSNEPGYYKEGAYGIRVENLLVTVPSDKDGFLEFETLSLYPIDIKLIDEAIFDKREKAWLNRYHYKVLNAVGPLLEGDVKSWFELKCRPMN
ncbi:MAG: aminopeptidase P family protein [Saprospiraceae bacterium]|nr:aminopeptidase P family protein [Saprospiraceae bacterium]